MSKVPASTCLFLAIGLVAASQSGNLIRIGHASPVAIAAWRLILASVIMSVFAGRGLLDVLKLSRIERLSVVAAGVALSAHLIAWITAVQHTKIANAAIFFSINPVITSVAAWFVFGERITIRLLISVALGLAGIWAIGYDDFQLSKEHLFGDMMALLCSFLFTIYFLLGKNLRKKLGSAAYVSCVYFVAGLAAFAVVIPLGIAVFDYDVRTWLCFLSLAIIPTAIGHTSLNHALRYINASRISALTLSEPVMAGAVAWYAWGEKVDRSDILGFFLITLSVLVLLSEEKSE